jgi:hypothetical protein
LFQQLLWTEEFKMESDMLEFSLEAVSMTQVGGFLKLRVKDLEESRPSLVKGDFVLAL